MSTYRELVHMCLDELKMISDDSHFQEEHILFLLDKYRGFLLKLRYSDIKKEMPESNLLTICLDLERVPAYDNSDICGGRGYLKSKLEVPEMMTISNPKISSTDYFQGDITYTNRERFKYVGNNKYLLNSIYSTIGPNEYLYIKSSNPQAYYLDKVTVTGVFEDSSKAAELECNNDSEDKCDVLDKKFPLEEALIVPLILLVTKDLGAANYNAEDPNNNATDDLGQLARYLAQNLKRRKDLSDDDYTV